MQTNTYTDAEINLTEASGAAVLTENPGQAQCVACRVKDYGGAIENVCVWARYAVYNVCVLAIFSVYCRCTSIIGLGGCKHGQADPKTAARTAFYC